jgi:hypothetical protein
MTGVDPLRLGREPPPPQRPAADHRPDREAGRVEPPAALPPPAPPGIDNAARAAPRMPPAGLGALILAFAAPRDFDRQLLQPDRLQAILGDTLAALDQADPADEIADIASAVIAEELARHMALARICATEAPLPANGVALP